MKIFIAIVLYVIIAIIFVVVETIIEVKEKWWKIDKERIVVRGFLWPIIIFISSMGNVSQETLKNYIENQGK